MRATLQRHAIGLALVLPFLLLSTQDAESQRRGKKAKEEAKITAEITAEFTLTIGVREQIREYYMANPQPELDALPPGIRKRLAKGEAPPSRHRQEGRPRRAMVQSDRAPRNTGSSRWGWTFCSWRWPRASSTTS